ncbi:GTP cyclohydrolase I FolE [Aetokthonos hydrillicola]|uniref:GTP cyclohydrolase I FolE n=1 Tax=Aetokthonos hydrillicola TaxID=1550245 RepID=UPI001FBA71CD|nr:GTP cyclohydrolase I FolE [Aetokthonos hydrillicola]
MSQFKESDSQELSLLEAAKSTPQPVHTQNLAQASELLRKAMQLLWGDSFNTEGMEDTPARVAKFWAEMTWGLHKNPSQPLQRTFQCEHNEIVVLRDIKFSSLCEHHLLPFSGVAHVGYIPQGRVVGLSKIPRCLDIIAARPQMQERITYQLANTIHNTLNALGTFVVIEAEHNCMNNRGVLKYGSKTITNAVLGVFKTDVNARGQILSLIASSKL